MTRSELRDKLGGLLEQQLTLAEGVGGLISSDAANALWNLAAAYAELDTTDDN
jgi:hypothetical protein